MVKKTNIVIAPIEAASVSAASTLPAYLTELKRQIIKILEVQALPFAASPLPNGTLA